MRGLILITALVLSGCGNMKLMPDNPYVYEDRGCLAPPVFYDNTADLQKFCRGFSPVNPLRKINACYNYPTRTIHMVRPNGIHNWMETAGHELYHHWFGSYHD